MNNDQPIVVFYHIACMSGEAWKKIVYRQLTQMRDSGIFFIKSGVIGTSVDIEIIKNIAKEINVEIEILYRNDNFNNFEFLTLDALQKWVHTSGDCRPIMYLHTKGVSYPADRKRIIHRELMMNEFVANWKNLFIKLDTLDAIGMNWRENRKMFGGNFWIASVCYLKELDSIIDYGKRKKGILGRVAAETWIGTKFPKVESIFCKNVGFLHMSPRQEKEFYKILTKKGVKVC